MTYNGHKNWNHWNVSLWINNDEGLYRLARDTIAMFPGRRDAAVRTFIAHLAVFGVTKTPDGAPYSKSAVESAMRGME
jgi:hypothetical protein